VEEEEEDQEEEEEEEKREKEEISQEKKKTLRCLAWAFFFPPPKNNIGKLGEVSLVWEKKKKNRNLQPRSLSYPDWDIKYTTHPGVYWSAD